MSELGEWTFVAEPQLSQLRDMLALVLDRAMQLEVADIASARIRMNAGGKVRIPQW